MTARVGDGLPGFSDQDLPLAAGSLTGLRLWRVDLSSLEAVSKGTPLAGVAGPLTGVFGAAWGRGENVAVCGGGLQPAAGHPAPVPAHRCGCGFWAYWTRRDAQRSDYWRADVIGIMQGYGRTRIGTRGCRCSKARILAVHVPQVAGEIRAWGLQPQRVAEILGDYYGVPWFQSLEEMLAAHPPTADYLPRRRQHLAAAQQRQPGAPASVSWQRVLAFAAAYAVLAFVLISLAAWWSPRALAVIVAIMVTCTIWPVGTLWLPRWARKLPGGRGPGPAMRAAPAKAPHPLARPRLAVGCGSSRIRRGGGGQQHHDGRDHERGSHDQEGRGEAEGVDHPAQDGQPDRAHTVGDGEERAESGPPVCLADGVGEDRLQQR